MIKFKNVHKHFKDLHVINGVNLEIKQGEVVVVCGPSGSGNSTLIRTVNQLEPIQQGEIWVDGVNVADPATDLNKIRTEVGFVFQHFNLYPHLTVLENIVLSPMKVKKISRADAEQKALELLDRVGLKHKKDALPGELSGGQQQRCAIGRALVKNPGLLLCDEPTGALDYKTSKEILQLMEDVNRTYGCTIIIVTHNAAIARMANRVLRLRDGRIVEDELNESPFSAAELDW